MLPGDDTPLPDGPAAAAARAAGAGSRTARRDRRPYPQAAAGTDPEADAVALAALRAMLRAPTARAVAEVLACAVRDLGGALVPARLAPDDALPCDVSLGLGEPVVVVVDGVSVAALRLSAVLPGLVEDAVVAVARLTRGPAASPVEPRAAARTRDGSLVRLRLHGAGSAPDGHRLVDGHHQLLRAVRSGWSDLPDLDVTSTTVGEVVALLPGTPPQEVAARVHDLLGAVPGLPLHAGVAALDLGVETAMQRAARALVRARSTRRVLVVDGS